MDGVGGENGVEHAVAEEEGIATSAGEVEGEGAP